MTTFPGVGQPFTDLIAWTSYPFCWIWDAQSTGFPFHIGTFRVSCENCRWNYKKNEYEPDNDNTEDLEKPNRTEEEKVENKIEDGKKESAAKKVKDSD